jgi:hypothetical protein
MDRGPNPINGIPSAESPVPDGARTVLESSADRPKVGRKKDPQKSRITNGSALLPGVDQRCAWVRRAKDVIAAHLSDIPDASAAERSIVRRAATLTVELERMEAVFAVAGQAQPFEIDLYQRTANSLRRLLEAVGIQRRPRDVSPPRVDEYLTHLNGDGEVSDAP